MGNVIASKSMTPRGGWKYLERETGTWITGGHYGELLRNVRVHREYKGLDPDLSGELIDQQICQRLGPKACKEYDEYYPNQAEMLDDDKLMNFSRSAVDFLKSGGEVVDAQESSRRAEICRKCPFNVSSGCSCSFFYKLLEKLVPKPRREPGLRVCTVCGCSLVAKALMPLAVLRRGNAGTEFPEWCWQREAIDNNE